MIQKVPIRSAPLFNSPCMRSTAFRFEIQWFSYVPIRSASQNTCNSMNAHMKRIRSITSHWRSYAFCQHFPKKAVKQVLSCVGFMTFHKSSDAFHQEICTDAVKDLTFLFVPIRSCRRNHRLNITKEALEGISHPAKRHTHTSMRCQLRFHKNLTFPEKALMFSAGFP